MIYHKDSKSRFSKIGNYFSKGAKFLTLSAFLALTNCSNNSITGGNTTGGNSGSKPGYEQPSEQDAAYIFSRHQFVNTGDSVNSTDSDATKIAFKKKYYNDAKNYMGSKIDAYNDKIQNFRDAENFLSDVNVQNNYGTISLDPIIKQQNQDLGKALGTIWYHMPDYQTRDEFKACCDWLMWRGYNESLGNQKDSNSLKSNRERTAIEQELTDLGITLEGRAIEDHTMDIIRQVSDNETMQGIMKDTVNLVIDNAAEHALRDLGAQIGMAVEPGNTVYKPQGQLDFRERDNFDRFVKNRYVELYYQDRQQSR